MDHTAGLRSVILALVFHCSRPSGWVKIRQEVKFIVISQSLRCVRVCVTV